MWKCLQASFSPKKIYFSSPDCSAPSEVKESMDKSNIFASTLKSWECGLDKHLSDQPTIFKYMAGHYSISAKKHWYLTQLQRVSEVRSLLRLKEQKYLRNLSKRLEKKPVNFHGFTLTVLESILCLHRLKIESIWLY